MRLKDKVALITGAASKKGIGYSIAVEFAKEGALVIATDIIDPIETKDDINKMGFKSESIIMDVSDEKQVNETVDWIFKKHAVIDILVNNAGICTFLPFLESNKDMWDVTLDVNLTGVFLCSLAVVKKMVEARVRGKIINISSMCVEYPSVNQSSYAASKGGVYMLSKNMALELAPYRINVNSIAPVGMETNIVQKGKEILEMSGLNNKTSNKPIEKIGEIKGTDEENRPANPHDIARVALFLSSDDASQITGQTIFVNGFDFIR